MYWLGRITGRIKAGFPGRPRSKSGENERLFASRRATARATLYPRDNVTDCAHRVMTDYAGIATSRWKDFLRSDQTAPRSSYRDDEKSTKALLGERRFSRDSMYLLEKRRKGKKVNNLSESRLDYERYLFRPGNNWYQHRDRFWSERSEAAKGGIINPRPE